MNSNGAIYIRVSTDKQEELSPDAQKRLLLEYAENHDIHIADEHIFQDNGISGRKAGKRPSFQNMIALAKAKEHPFDCIIVWKYSRFARNQEESILYKSLLRKAGVDVISISENTDGEFGTLIERIIEWMDEYYSIRLSGEVMRGMTQNAMRGHYQSAPPIGYKAMPDSPPVIDPETKVIPLMIKDMFLSGKKPIDITRYLNAMGYHTKRGNSFDVRGIKYILSNPFYCGISRWNYTERGRKLKPDDEVILTKGNWEPLWDEGTYRKIQFLLDEQKGTVRKKQPSSCKHWLSGLLICSSCGRSLSCSGGSNHPGFQCWGYGKGLCTGSHYISETKATSEIIDGLNKFLIEGNIPYCQTPLHSDERKDEIQLNHLKKGLIKLKEKEKRAKEAYLDGIDTKEEYKQNKESISASAELIQARIRAIEARTNHLPCTENHQPYTENHQPCADNHQPITNGLKKTGEPEYQNVKGFVEVLKDPEIDYITKGEAFRSVADQIVYNKEEHSYSFYLHLKV